MEQSTATDVQQLNVLIDSMAKHALMKVLLNRIFIDLIYPVDEIVSTDGGWESVGSSATNINC